MNFFVRVTLSMSKFRVLCQGTLAHLLCNFINNLPNPQAPTHFGNQNARHYGKSTDHPFENNTRVTLRAKRNAWKRNIVTTVCVK